MTTPSKSHAATKSSDELKDFLEGVCTSDPFKVERDYGQGYVKLRSTEAEKRQAAQDIKCVEDIVIELLRNSRDAGARMIFLATAKEGEGRSLTIIDDGQGIPADMWERIFEPRVTSKLETAHMDKWGMHGRGMALYSTKVNVDAAQVVASEMGFGSSLRISTGPSLPEKTDQSTFPHFEEANGVMVMRGPKNIIRTCCEFALEHRHELTVHMGSPAQIVAALYRYGLATIPAYARAFAGDEQFPLTRILGLAHSPDDLKERAAHLGLDISLRTARRIMDGQSEEAEDLTESMARASFKKARRTAKPTQKGRGKRPSSRPRLQDHERAAFLQSIMDAYEPIADAYYLNARVSPSMQVESDRIVIEIPLTSCEDDDKGASGL